MRAAQIGFDSMSDDQRFAAAFRHRLLQAICLFALASAGQNQVCFAEEQEQDNAALAAKAADGVAYFTDEVQPLLVKNCFKCHSGAEAEGGLRLTSRESILSGGDSGPAIDLAAPAASLLLEAINYESYEMPPTGKLSPGSIAVITRWVELGIPMPEGELVVDVDSHAGPPEVNEETKNHWSFRPLQRPDVPADVDPNEASHPIDAFILSRLREAGLSMSPPADRRELMRRVHYDLLGLPPTPEEVEAFAADESPDAWEQLIERLLESPHYGEHWARYWLDLVRYAESNSYERDNPKPFVWRYRDYVIDAFNHDKPYDQFVREQLAGDELAEETAESIIATGYYRLGLWDDEPVDRELAFYDGLDDIAATTGQAFLGLTMNCARCHDHKLDPIPQADYYRFIAFFRNIRHYGVRGDDTVFAASVRDISSAEDQTKFETERAAHEQRLAELRTRIDEVENGIRDRLRGGERDDFQDDRSRSRIIRRHIGDLISEEDYDAYSELRREWRELRDHPPRIAAQALCIKEDGADSPPTFVLARGMPAAKTDEVQPAFPEVLSPPAAEIQVPADRESTGRRLALANWITSPQNPLTARVMANRIWQWHFGRGIVRSSNDFGLQGDAPTHPELLDWLASEFIARGWSIKEMHRLILTSRAYRMSSMADGQGLRAEGQELRENQEANVSLSPGPLSLDPMNNLFWRFDPRRLRAEEVRDSILAVNGTLNLDKRYGPSVYEVIPPEVLAGQSMPGHTWGRSSEDDSRRRSTYIHVKRSLQVPLLAAFDAADTDFTCPVRFATTQPTQALTLLNSDFLQQQAAAFAAYVREEAGDEPRERIAFALQQVTQRPPTDAEIDRGLELTESLQSEHGLDADQSLKYFCLLALNLNEFVYLD